MRQRWQRKRERAHHVDDWLMTYADVITLLLCFFAVALAYSMPRMNIPFRDNAPKPVTQLVHQPDILQGDLPYHDLPDDDQPEDEGNRPLYGIKHTDIPNKDALNQAPPVPVEPTPSPSMDVAANAPPTQASLPEIVDTLKTQGTADIKQTGDRITTMQMSSGTFFDSGSAVLSEPGKAILRQVAVNLTSDQFKDYQITVEGHTDDSPINTAQFPSNWELSTARASAVVHFFLELGIPAQRLRAAGYADTFPIAPNRDATGNAIPENQAQNRRVVIKMEKIEKAQ